MPKQLRIALISLLVSGAAFYTVPLVRSAYQSPGKAAPEPLSPTRKPGVIEGSVWDADGRPVAGATVNAMRTFAKPRVPSAETDENGRYRIEIPEAGYYAMVCSKWEDGYPPTSSGFHQEEPAVHPTVTIQPGRIAQNVDIRLGPKMSKLVGTVSDAVTSKPLPNAAITVRRVDDPRLYYLTGIKEGGAGSFEILVPTLPFTIEVEAPGYEMWKYNKSSLKEDGEALKLERGETKELMIRLQPEKQL